MTFGGLRLQCEQLADSSVIEHMGKDDGPNPKDDSLMPTEQDAVSPSRRRASNHIPGNCDRGDRSHSMPKKQPLHIDGRELTVSNLDKVLFPECGFYQGAGDQFLHRMCRRHSPSSPRSPADAEALSGGIAGEHFYEKNAP